MFIRPLLSPEEHILSIYAGVVVTLLLSLKEHILSIHAGVVLTEPMLTVPLLSLKELIFLVYAQCSVCDTSTKPQKAYTLSIGWRGRDTSTELQGTYPLDKCWVAHDTYPKP